jgi:hypothetical protein
MVTYTVRDNHAACGTIRRMKIPLTLTLSQRERVFSGS